MTDTITGRLVVAADPSIEIRGPSDVMPSTTNIATTSAVVGGAFEFDYGGGYENFYEEQHTLTDRRGFALYYDHDGREWPEDALAIQTEDGELHPLPSKPGPIYMLTAPGEVTLSRAILAEMLAYEAEAFEEDTPIDLADLCTAFGEFRARIKAALGLPLVGVEASYSLAPDEFERSKLAGYTVVQTDAWERPGGEAGGRWGWNAPDGEGCGVGYATERAAWEACDRHLSGGTAAPLPPITDKPVKGMPSIDQADVGRRIRITSIADDEEQDLRGLTGRITHPFPGKMTEDPSHYRAGVYLDEAGLFGPSINLMVGDEFEFLS